MPISLKWLYGRKLAASDGTIGHVDDFYFEDQRWAVRYVVADTSTWLTGRLVLISPYAFGHLEHCAGRLPIHLTRKQIEDSPATELHKPISRQYEERYHAYYEWPTYWNGGGLWGVGSYPAEPPPDHAFERETPESKPLPSDDPHLRSTRSVTGHEVETKDGVIGEVTDFLVDEYSWMIRYLVVDTGQWFSGHKVVISPKDIDRVSYGEAKIFVNLTKENILHNPDHKMPETFHEESPTPTL